MIIGLLAGALNRAAVGREVIDFVKHTDKATNTGHAICALAIDTFVPVTEFKRAVDGIIRDIRNSRRLPGVERIWLPGERTTPSCWSVAPAASNAEAVARQPRHRRARPRYRVAG